MQQQTNHVLDVFGKNLTHGQPAARGEKQETSPSLRSPRYCQCCV